MRAVLEQLEGLIQFQGPNFRSTAIECSHCGWRGTGGSLEVPVLAASGEPVVYACPECMEAIAVHNGLSDEEVMQEMAKIRQILADELQETHTHLEAAKTIKPQAKPDFAAIRAQLPTKVDAAVAEVAADEGELAVAEPATSKKLTGDDLSTAGDNPGADLDFEAIRARLGAIA